MIIVIVITANCQQLVYIGMAITFLIGSQASPYHPLCRLDRRIGVEVLKSLAEAWKQITLDAIKPTVTEWKK